MMIHTYKRTVTFRQPFTLKSIDEILPAGAYTVETDEEPLTGIASSSGTKTEDAYLAAFDASRDAILQVAQKAYSKSRKNLIELTAADFR